MYGGTKSEMQRLIKDAAKLTDIQQKLGITVDKSSMSFDNVVNAISVMQTKLDIAGTSAKEATETVQGSISMTKAALDNLLTGFGDKNADLKKLTQDFIDSFVGYTDEAGDHVKGMLDNVVPVVSNAIKSIVTALPELGKAIVHELPSLFQTIKETLGELFSNLADELPSMIEELAIAWEELIEMFYQPENMKSIIDLAFKLLEAFGQGLIDALPHLLKALPTIVEGVITWILNFAPKIATLFPKLIGYFLMKTPEVLMSLIQSVSGILGSVVKAIWDFLNEHIIGTFKQWWANFTKVLDVITPFFKGIWESIQNAFSNVGTWFVETFSKAWEGIKNVFSATGQMFGNIGKSILNGLSSVINGIIWGINQVIKMPLDGLNAILRLIHDIDIFGLKPFSWIGQIPVPQIPSIPMLAEGGVLKRGQMALLEGQGDEAVIPLSQNTEWIDMVANRLKNSEPQQIYYSFNINVDRMSANSEDDIEALADKLMEIMAEKGARKGMGLR